MQRESGDPETSDENEITVEMIEAGVAVLWGSGAVEHPTSVDRNLVRKIFLAMQAAGREDGWSCP